MIRSKILFLLFIPVVSFASKNVDPCEVEHGGVTAGYECVEQKIRIADKELNRSYKEALERISNEASDLEDVFRSAQRAWLKFKDAECEFIGSSFTSSPWQGVQIEKCKLDMMKKRIIYFNEVFVG